MLSSPWPVLAHVNAASLLDEGTGAIFDLMQEKAAVDGVIVAVHGFNPEVVDRGRVWPGHGPKGSNGSLGGYFATDHAEFNRFTRLGSSRVREEGFQRFDVMEVAIREAAPRGLDVFVYILESAGTGGFQRNVTGWPQVLEIDVTGRRGTLPCVNHPDYRAWKFGLLEDLYSSYVFRGLLWGAERWGPMHKAIAGDVPACFCDHCRAVAVGEGLHWPRVRQGYVELNELCHSGPGNDGSRSLLRLMLKFPEILAWEAAWTRAYLNLHREIYGMVKWMAPDRLFGLGLWHYWFINPLLHAEWDMRDFAKGSDFIRPILYHRPEGPRIQRYLGMISNVVPALRQETTWAFLCDLLGLDLPDPATFATLGLSPDYVAQGVRIARADAQAATPIIAGIGIDVFEHDLHRQTDPDDVAAAILAAHHAGANGITLSRNYAEMRHANLEAVGRTVRALRSAAPSAAP
jgi:hypothetical protein